MKRLVVLVVVAICALAGCGGGGDGVEAAGSVTSELDQVIDGYGRALFTGDGKAFIAFLPPEIQNRGESVEDMDVSSPVAGQVELRDFGYEVVRQTASSAQVNYSGMTCGPEVRNEREPTSGTASVDESISTVVPGSIVLGEVICRDIADFFEEPIEFIREDGRWYGMVPGADA